MGQILHAGDIGNPAHLESLARLAPVTAIRGNVDRGAWADDLPERVSIEIDGMRIHMIHDRKTLTDDPTTQGWDVVISGHSHKPSVDDTNGVLWLNPGAAGPRRFRLPITVAYLWNDAGRACAVIHPLPV